MDGLKLNTAILSFRISVSQSFAVSLVCFLSSLGKQLCFLSVQGQKGNFMTNKVENRREHNITSAAKNGDWTKVDKLLNQPIDNLERKKRYYGE